MLDFCGVWGGMPGLDTHTADVQGRALGGINLGRVVGVMGTHGPPTGTSLNHGHYHNPL